jgi:hypothetical protein
MSRRPSLAKVLSALAALLVLPLAAQRAGAQPILINFDDLPGMSNAPGAPIPEASRLADQYLASHNVRFSSGSPFVAVVIHGGGTPSGVQLMGGSTPDGLLTYNHAFPVAVEFLSASDLSPMVVSQVSITGDLFSIPGTKTIEAFDVEGTLIGTQTHQDSDAQPLTVSAPGIHRARFFSESATVGFDDLRFDTPVPAGAACAPDIGAAGGVPGHDGHLDNNDFIAFINYFFASDPQADRGVAGGLPGHDGHFDNNDFIVFITQFFQGC